MLETNNLMRSVTRKLHPAVQQVQPANRINKKKKKKEKRKRLRQWLKRRTEVRLTGILSSSSGPVIIKGNNRNGQHRFKAELQESSDPADNQNTGICACIQLNKGFNREMVWRTASPRRWDNANDVAAKKKNRLPHVACHLFCRLSFKHHIIIEGFIRSVQKDCVYPIPTMSHLSWSTGSNGGRFCDAEFVLTELYSGCARLIFTIRQTVA